MKYLDEMTDKEITDLGKKEKLFLGLFFNRKSIIEKLIKLGYELSPKRIDEKIESVKEIDFSKIPIYRDRSRVFYRNYPNKKLMRKIRKKYRGNKKRFNYGSFYGEELSTNFIKRRFVETEINKSKFDIGKEAETEIKRDIYFDREFLPGCYYVDEVVLMPKNPTTLYVYWEIREDTFEKLKESNGVNEGIVIKVYKDGEEYRKIIRYERIGSHYITNVETNENYEAHIGYEDNYGNFVEVASSPTVIAPSDKISDNIDVTWGTVKEENNRVLKYINKLGNTFNGSVKEWKVLTGENEMDEWDIDGEHGGIYIEEIIRKMKKISASEYIYEDEVNRKLVKDLKEVGSSWGGASEKGK